MRYEERIEDHKGNVRRREYKKSGTRNQLESKKNDFERKEFRSTKDKRRSYDITKYYTINEHRRRTEIK